MLKNNFKVDIMAAFLKADFKILILKFNMEIGFLLV